MASVSLIDERNQLQESEGATVTRIYMAQYPSIYILKDCDCGASMVSLRAVEWASGSGLGDALAGSIATGIIVELWGGKSKAERIKGVVVFGS